MFTHEEIAIGFKEIIYCYKQFYTQEAIPNKYLRSDLGLL